MKQIFATMLLALLCSNTYAQKQTSSALLTDWMELHCRMVRKTKGIGHINFSRHFAYTAIAAYETVAGADPSYQSLQNQLKGFSNLPTAPAGKSAWAAGLNAAYASMLRNFYGVFTDCSVTIDSMERVQDTKLRTHGFKTQQIEKSRAYGKEIAAAVISWSATDGSNNESVYTPEKKEGLWLPSPNALMPYWSDSRSFTNVLSQVKFTAPAYSSDPNSDFYKMVNEVYITGKNLTPEQRATALYWDDSPNGKYITVFGHWTFILAGIIKEKGLALTPAAEAFAKMAMSMYEAGIVAWKGKYQYRVLRPVAYIQQYIDKDWTPLISTPPHPEFPAAHATLSYSAATALSSLFGNNLSLTDHSYVDLGMKERKFPSLQEAAKEAGYSRLYGGIHYRHSIEQGFLLGEYAAKSITQNISFRKK